MHRLIVNSATWRQISRLPDSADAELKQRWSQTLNVDPTNRLLSRGHRRRLGGEAIRDAMLFASDDLTQRRGGPGIRPPLPDELVRTLLRNQWPVSKNSADFSRRSIYLFVRRNLRYPLFDVFDKPDTNASCPRRNESTIAPQALMLLNAKLSLEVATSLASSISRESTDPQSQIEELYRRTVSRVPNAHETDVLLDAFHASVAGGATRTEALTDICLALINTNEFVYVD